MIVLCSDGLSSTSLRASLRPKIKNAKTAALVVTADHIFKEKNYHVDRCIHELAHLGLITELFDLDVHDAKLLLCYDVIEFIGGNPFYLLNSIQEHRAEEILKKIASQKCLIGWSAAAFVFGPTLELVNQYSPELNFLCMKSLTGLSLTDIEVLPHYSKFAKKMERFEEICAEYEIKHKKKIVRLNDGDGVIITREENTLIRKS